MTDNIYVFDTSSFIELERLKTYSDVFVSLWSNLEKLVNAKQLISPKKVLEDLRADLENPKAKSNALINWVKDHEKLFQDENDQEFLNALQRIANKYQKTWVDIDSEKNQSDPYVVALAVSKKKKLEGTLFGGKVIVVTEEDQNLNRLKIPKVCNEYGIRCLNLHQFFQAEGWKF